MQEEQERRRKGLSLIAIGVVGTIVGIIVYAVGENAANKDTFCGFESCDPSVGIVILSSLLVGGGMGLFVWGLSTYTGQPFGIPVRMTDGPTDPMKTDGTSASPAQHDVGTALGQLQTLHHNGLISDSEFQAKKAEILDRL